jgi:hypothetical protein
MHKWKQVFFVEDTSSNTAVNASCSQITMLQILNKEILNVSEEHMHLPLSF